MKLTYTYSLNRQWHFVFSLKQFVLGFSIEFENIFILCLGWFSVTWIRK